METGEEVFERMRSRVNLQRGMRQAQWWILAEPLLCGVLCDARGSPRTSSSLSFPVHSENLMLPRPGCAGSVVRMQCIGPPPSTAPGGAIFTLQCM